MYNNLQKKQKKGAAILLSSCLAFSGKRAFTFYILLLVESGIEPHSTNGHPHLAHHHRHHRRWGRESGRVSD